jgi:hypothetical protein
LSLCKSEQPEIKLQNSSASISRLKDMLRPDVYQNDDDEVHLSMVTLKINSGLPITQKASWSVSNIKDLKLKQ